MDLLEWARAENPQLRIEVEPRTMALRVISGRGEVLEHRLGSGDWIDVLRRAGVRGRS